MRENKFRAWDGVQYYYDIVPLFSSMEIILNHPLAGNKLHKVEVFEEYTSLRDKSGREIYEGDIVGSGAVVHFGEGYRISWDYDDHTELKFIGWYLDGLTDCEDMLYNGELEVIGNINENPELVET